MNMSYEELQDLIEYAKTTLEEHKKSIEFQEAAIQMRSIYEAITGVGFSEDQAMKIILASIKGGK